MTGFRGVAEREVRRVCAKHGLNFFTVPAHHFVFLYGESKENWHMVPYRIDWDAARIDEIVDLFRSRAEMSAQVIKSNAERYRSFDARL